MNVVIRPYYYMMPRLAKICEIVGTPILSMSVIAAAILVYRNQSRDHRCESLGIIGACCLITRDILRIYRSTPVSIKTVKVVQCVLLAGGVIATVGALVHDQENYFQSAVGVIGLTTATHLVIKIASYML